MAPSCLKSYITALFLVMLFSFPCHGEDRFITLVFHDITAAPTEKDDISEKVFINQIEYFRSHGYTFLSHSDIVNAAKVGKPLPSKGILLTFDDAYASFHSFVYPLLKLHGIPAILSVVTSWIDSPEKASYKGKQFMTWKQIREVSDSGIVTVASHSKGLHTIIPSNPPGNLEPAAVTLRYMSEQNRYETPDELSERVRSDLAGSVAALQQQTGKKPVVFTWPYGSYNSIGIDEAKKLGFTMIMTLDEGYSDIKQLDRLQRHYLSTQADWTAAFNDAIARDFSDITRTRAVQIDLDMIITPNSYDESDRNLGLLIERLIKLGVNTVFIQGFCDRDGTGNIRSLYFANSVLPAEMDFLSHAVNRIKAQGIRAYVWMPLLSYELPDTILNESLKVREIRNGTTQVTTSWYRRLSPFSPRSREIAMQIFRDLSSTVNLDGILIQDDAYLTDFEDYHPDAIGAYRARFGIDPDPVTIAKDAGKAEQWTRFKVEGLDSFADAMTSTVKSWRPAARIARNIYSRPVIDPASTQWFAQDFSRYLSRYDLIVVMAYAPMERENNARDWYRRLFAATGGEVNSSRVLFKIQAYDWKAKQWVKDADLKDELTYLLSLGARHIAYYPDNTYDDKPGVESISAIMSARTDVRLKPLPPPPGPAGFIERLIRTIFPGTP